MSEWKRVFCSPQRVGAMLLLTGMSVVLFIFSLLDRIEPHAFQSMFEAAGYAARTIEQWKGIPLKELPEVYAAEESRIAGYSLWVHQYEWMDLPFSSGEEAERAVSDLPYLIERSADVFDFERARMTLWRSGNYINEEIIYLNSYYDYLEGIQEQARQQSQIGIFHQGNSFAGKNMQKTARDFEGLGDVAVEFGNNIGVERWLDFNLADYLFLIGIGVFVLSFLEERRKGLWSAVRSCKNGRARMGFTRIGILGAASAVCTLLVYGTTLAVSLSINGGWADLGRSLQSLESFRTCTIRTSIAGWLLIYFGVKLASGLLTGLFLWCVLGIVSNIQFSLSVLGGILAGEYLLYEFLPVQSAFNILKYFNIFSYVHTSCLYTDYLNINLFGIPVGIRPLMLAVLPAASVLLAVCAVLIQSRRYPEGNRDMLSKLSGLLNRVLDLFCTRFTIGVWEIYKTLIYELVIIMLGVAVLGGLSLEHILLSSERDVWYQAYLSDLEGPLDETSDGYIERARESIRPGMNEYELTGALDRLERDVAEIKADARAGGYEPWLVDAKIYDSVYGSLARDCQRLTAGAAIIFLVFCCAGIAAYERHAGVLYMVRSLRRGRQALFTGKAVVAVLLAVFVWAAVFMQEFSQFLSVLAPVTLDAPVRSIAALARFPLNVTFAQYLVMLYAVRLVMLVCVAFFVLLISSYAANLQTAYLLNLGFLGIPAMLAVLGVNAMEYVSPLVPVSSAELMWRLGGGDFKALIPWAAWLFAGTAALAAAGRKWVK